MKEYRFIKKLGEGTFSEVFKAQDKKTGTMVAMKCMKSSFSSKEQVNNLKEIQSLKRLSAHANVVQLHDIIFDEATGRLALVFELMDQNMYESIKGKKNYLPEKKIQSYMYQLLKALDYMHRKGIFHRDIKPENILLKDDLVKLADFGSCKGIYSKPPFTEYISTRWYRAPECLLTDGHYNFKMDLWGVGCVFFEMLTLFPLFPGDDEMDQIHKIHDILGTPSESLLKHFQKLATHIEFDFPHKVGIGINKFLSHVSEDCKDLINKLLIYNPEERISAKQALNHPYFKDLKKQDEKLMKMSTLSK